jgi:hypothetical protein
MKVNMHTNREDLANPLSKTICILEDSLQSRGAVCAIFFDIGGAFDNVSWEAVDQGLRTKGITTMVREWCRASLECRTVTVKVGEIEKRARLTRGTPQGGGGYLTTFLESSC